MNELSAMLIVSEGPRAPYSVRCDGRGGRSGCMRSGGARRWCCRICGNALLTSASSAGQTASVDSAPQWS